MDRLNSHFLRPISYSSRGVSGDGQSALLVKLGVSPIPLRLLTGSHRYHPGIVQQAQLRSAETAVSPHHNYQSTVPRQSRNSPDPRTELVSCMDTKFLNEVLGPEYIFMKTNCIFPRPEDHHIRCSLNVIW
jgi:hypothetical protein